MSKDNWDNAQEVSTNWFKFDEVGKKIKGTLVKRWVQKGDGDFGDQLISTLRLEDGDWNVGISMKKSGTVQRLQACKIGEIIGVIFDKEGEPSKKGYNPPKFLKVVTFGMDEGYTPDEESDAPLDVDSLPF